MRYLRMLTNALAGGVLGALYLTILVLQINPHVPVVSSTAAGWFGALLSMYGPYVTVGILIAILAREAVASRPLHPGWVSVRILAWLSAAAAVTAAWLTWANLQGLRPVLTAAAADRMHQGAVATTACAVVLVGVAVLRYSFGRRGNRPAAILMVTAVGASAVLPLWFRGPGEALVPAAHRVNQARPVTRPPRVRIVALDGAPRGFLLQRVAAGRLPNFGKLIDRGALLDLATLRPTQAEPVWASAATGKYPPKTGVRSEFAYHVGANDPTPVDVLPDYCFAQALHYQGFIRAEPRTAADLQARPMWDILADYGVPSGVVNWPLTQAAAAAFGFLISDVFDEATSSPLRLVDARAGNPTTAVDIARDVFDRWQAVPWTEILPGPALVERVDGLRRARWDRAYLAAERELTGWFAPRLTTVRLEAGDELGHWHLRDAEPERFGEVRRGGVDPPLLDRYYTLVDAWIDRAIADTAPGDLLLVVSGFGLERTSLAKRWLARALGELPATGTHESAPDGLLIAYGAHVAPGEYRRGSIVDLAPTVLYYMGLPIGRDMDGFARTDIFRASFTKDHPVTYTPTHER
jgi:hypothetical protein